MIKLANKDARYSVHIAATVSWLPLPSAYHPPNKEGVELSSTFNWLSSFDLSIMVSMAMNGDVVEVEGS